MTLKDKFVAGLCVLLVTLAANFSAPACAVTSTHANGEGFLNSSYSSVYEFVLTNHYDNDSSDDFQIIATDQKRVPSEQKMKGILRQK